MSLNLTGELHIMTIRNDAKIEEELTCQFKFYVRSFDLST